MRVVVTRIGRDGTMDRRMVDTAASSDAGPWEDLIARALASPPLYRPVPGDPVYQVRVDEQVVLVAEHDLSGSLYDLVTAVLALGEALHRAGGQPAARALLAGNPWGRLEPCLSQEPPDWRLRVGGAAWPGWK
jgi:hypothetical protein